MAVGEVTTNEETCDFPYPCTLLSIISIFSKLIEELLVFFVPSGARMFFPWADYFGRPGAIPDYNPLTEVFGGRGEEEAPAAAAAYLYLERCRGGGRSMVFW